MTRLILIGGGGLAKEVAEIAELNGHVVVGYVGTKIDVLDRPYLGVMESLAPIRDRFDALAIAFGAVDRKSVTRRADIVRWVVEQGFPSIPLVSPHAIRSKGARVADGAIVAHGVVLSVDCEIGAFAIVNSCAIIGHDAKIGENVTVAPGAFVGGGVAVGQNTLLGPGAMVLQARSIGSDTVVGIGATVVRDVPPGSTVMPLLSRRV
jgi:sugar O-acyltransferase (sialic acid O-acetyltransferase NeuD family)